MNKLIAAAMLSLVTLCASAERADSLKQAVINYDSLDVDEVNGTRILTGNVVLTRGTLVLKSDKAVLKESPEGYMSLTLTSAPGHVATFRQKRDGGPDLWVEGQAERIEYDERTELVKLFSNAVVKQLENSKLTNEVDGPFISYDNRKEIVAVRNDVSGETKPGKGRGTLILAPRRNAQGAPAAPAPAAGK
ncbi:lipopolysaccharide transport periplasmic protein LptA [Massilia solisilvae]|uniref:Lipopolysaccharide export system protein LptA n=1 Tax=Massilia solisilvae TaxID=1811225 RepID=A0ABT2BQA5_9BURK|nr:lipopolysaccharide transport periplasmic protein LptA [Massilia solisilvae]MCS0610697.1 lipopolysaccharide transport periplasmic protein LptA [Massilia solisilvae]